MKLDPQIPIGKAMDRTLGDDDAEVTGHGLIVETGEPATSESPESEDSAGHDDSDVDGQPRVPDSE